MSDLNKTESFQKGCKDCTQQNSPHPCYLFDDLHQKANMSEEHYFFPVRTPIDIQKLNGATKKDVQTNQPTLICGDESKTLLAMEFLARGVIEHDEAGAFVTFEKSTKNLILNSTWLGFDLDNLIENRKISVNFVNDITINGEFNLENLFIELGCVIHNIGAKRVVLDTIEALFTNFLNPVLLRAELQRLFEWLRNKGIAVIVTGNRDDETLIHQELKELTQCEHFLV